MKKLLFLCPLLLVAVACAPKAEEVLPPSQADYSILITKSNCGLTADDSEVAIQTSLASYEDPEVKYTFEIGAPAYQHANFNEFVIKKGSYIKSVSEYKVERLIIDFYSSKGVNFNVFNNKEGSGSPLNYHESTILPEDPTDGGCVYEYEINGIEWCINNTSDYKPAFYSIMVVFSK